MAVEQPRNHQRSVRGLLSIRTGQNPESACGMWGQVAHLDHERDTAKGLDQPGRESVCGRCLELVRNAAFRINRQEKRSNCRRLKPRAIASTTNQRSREAHCGVRGPVRCLEGDRSGHGETKAARPATRHVDAHRVTMLRTRLTAPHTL